MKAILSEQYGGPDRLELREVDVPVPADNQALIRVHASSVNPSEWYRVAGPIFARLGEGLRSPKEARVGSDMAGRVEAVGKDFTEFQPGDEVFGTGLGAWAEYACAREARLVRKPANISFAEAGVVPIAAITALQALRDHGELQPGQRVVINGASGGVGTYTVQLAKSYGADVTAVCSTHNVEQASELGADRVVDYTREDFTKLGPQHDLLVDVGGGRSFKELRRVLTPEATVVVVGAKMKARGLGPLPHIARLKLGAIGRSQAIKFFIAKIEKADLEVLRDLLEAGTVRSVIDRTYDLSEVPEALRYLGEGHARAKIAITTGA